MIKNTKKKEHPHRRRKAIQTGSRQGFTLIELLVVIAIIALLMGLTVPVLSSARNKARLLKCSHNIRQWGLSFQMYAIDNLGDLPTLKGKDNGGWQEAIAPYLISYDNDVRRFELRKTLGCPGDETREGGWAYGTNQWMFPAVQNHPRSIDMIQSPTSHVILADTDNTGIWELKDTQPNGVQYVRHNGRASFCFADMHVETLSEEQALAAEAAGALILKND